MKEIVKIIVLVCMVVPTMAQGTVILGADSTVAIGIEGLVVGSDAFNVSFVRQLEADNVGNPGNVFFSNPAGAVDAINAIALELNANSILSVIEPSLDTGFRNLHVSIDPGAGWLWGGENIFTNPGVSAWGFVGSIFSNVNSVRSIALFEQVTAPVPEPTILALLSLGLAGLGFTRRKVKA